MSAIDPGMEDGIEKGAHDIESSTPEEDAEQQEEEDFHQPSRWWFASTACPLLAGTFGPMATGFNICALVEYWRMSLPLGGLYPKGTPIPDPTWLLVVNILSLIAAVAGNASLLLNMARRVKFSIAQPITISGFLLGGVLLVADLVAITSLPHYGIEVEKWEPNSRHQLTSAFYYGIFAAIIYIIVGILMCATVYGAKTGHYTEEFHLTSSQRTLMLQTMSFIVYLLLGALVYSHIEGWRYLTSVYWVNVTLLTVGLGDIHPVGRLGRGLLFPFAIGGVLILGLVIGSLRSLILERGGQKMSARIVEKRRETAVHNVDDSKQTIRVSIFAKADFSTDPSLSLAQRREEEFNVMRKVQDAAGNERRWFALAMSSSFALILWFVGAVIFQITEHRQEWSYLQALYFAYTSLLTIGYGDLAPKSQSGRAFFVFWSLLAVPSLTILISNMGDTIVKWVSDLTNWIGSFTVLPDEGGLRSSLKSAANGLNKRLHDSLHQFIGPGILGSAASHGPKYARPLSRTEYESQTLDRLADSLRRHLHEDQQVGDDQLEHDASLDKDIHFYHYVLARECRNLQKNITHDPDKAYDFFQWTYFLRLMNDSDEVPDALVAPDGLGLRSDRYGATPASSESDRKESAASSGDFQPLDGNVDRKTSLAQKAQLGNKRAADWSWLSDESPLMSQQSESSWILSRLQKRLEWELHQKFKGRRPTPPIRLKDARRRKRDSNTKEKEPKIDRQVEDGQRNRLAEIAKSEE